MSLRHYDKWIPEKPVSTVEAGGYSVVILGFLAVAVGAIWYTFKELLLEPKVGQRCSG